MKIRPERNPERAAQRKPNAKDTTNTKAAKAASICSKRREREAANALKCTKTLKTGDKMSKTSERYASQQTALETNALHAKET